MIGKRVYPSDDGLLRLGAGDFGKDSAGNWLLHHPKTGWRLVGAKSVTEHKDGTITVPGLIEKGVWKTE
jgi:hypothetical protein